MSVKLLEILFELKQCWKKREEHFGLTSSLSKISVFNFFQSTRKFKAQLEERFQKAPFSWRISVTGRADSNCKVASRFHLVKRRYLSSFLPIGDTSKKLDTPKRKIETVYKH